MTKVYDFKVKDAQGKEVDLADYKGKTLLLVNVASKCGYTPQYDGLEALYKKYKDKGLEIIGFPCNQFMAQEPGSNEEIQNFCRMNYGVTFKVLGKVEVNGENADPLFKYLTSEEPEEWVDVHEDCEHYQFFKDFHKGDWGRKVVWNFNKFLFDKNGKYVGRYASDTTPEELAEKIEKIL